MNIILCGLPKSGKSTLGSRLAKQLSLPFIDTDILIENIYFKKNSKLLAGREICLQHGEPFFREYECKAVESLKDAKNQIISLGGGTLSNPRNREVISSLGLIIYISTPLQTIWGRILQTGIPYFLKSNDPFIEFQSIANLRISHFQSIAHWTLNNEGLTVDDSVAAIKHFLTDKNYG